MKSKTSVKFKYEVSGKAENADTGKKEPFTRKGQIETVEFKDNSILGFMFAAAKAVEEVEVNLIEDDRIDDTYIESLSLKLV